MTSWGCVEAFFETGEVLNGKCVGAIKPQRRCTEDAKTDKIGADHRGSMSDVFVRRFATSTESRVAMEAVAMTWGLQV
jgi:hypothetical protein